jgi:O-succinylbenzoate synthase
MFHNVLYHMKVTFTPFLLEFKFDAGTSRGVLKARKSWIIKIEREGKIGFGEVAPLKGLSPEGYENFEEQLIKELTFFRQLDTKELSNHHSKFSSSTLFGLETAILNLDSEGDGEVFNNSFYSANSKIPINGLVWMGEIDFMKKQIQEKLSKGFSCIKMKIGAVDLDQELQILKNIRKEFSSSQLTLRVDANGAFDFDKAKDVLKKLEDLEIHSIEQPIEAGQIELMQKLCGLSSSVGVALDEELISIRTRKDKIEILDKILPQYIILKPTLHGGISGTREWISLAEERGIDWWITSALESNIGLNAICQLANEYKVVIPQGLGTGSLYTNNIPSPLEVNGENIYYNHNNKWDLSQLKFQEL